ncbi:hypothetical protein QJS66_08215 [Kocuria rhizophila]|nr:hypothetical protein QJS66_08215 [Kocuria rhizophila]
MTSWPGAAVLGAGRLACRGSGLVPGPPALSALGLVALLGLTACGAGWGRRRRAGSSTSGTAPRSTRRPLPRSA